VSLGPAEEPSCTEPEGGPIELLITARSRDLGGFSVCRLLPAMQRRLVGPFIFFDHLTRQELAPGQGMDVRPHPHIGLATVTYLFDGELVHRDSLGSRQPILDRLERAKQEWREHAFPRVLGDEVEFIPLPE